MRTVLLLTFWLSALAGCGEEPAEGAPAESAEVVPVGDSALDASDWIDSRGTDAAPPPPAEPPATEYCERSVDVFCPYYLRCGRMAVDDLESCQSTFLEVCNAVYEPIYVALAERGLLGLDSGGLAACKTHLDAVPCDAQTFDLEGACRDVWAGKVAQGGDCGPGIESFVCDANTTCVVGLDFCGTCETAASTGAVCGPDLRCHPHDACHQGSCVARPVGGQPCDDVIPCVLGTTCLDGACQGDVWVTPGAACGQGKRCQYKSACVGGICTPLGLVGESCPCAGGWCDAEDVCQPYAGSGELCQAAQECRSGACEGGACAAIATSCL